MAMTEIREAAQETEARDDSPVSKRTTLERVMDEVWTPRYLVVVIIVFVLIALQVWVLF